MTLHAFSDTDSDNVSHLSCKALKALWAKTFGTPIPSGRNAPIHKRILAWELEAAKHGGLDTWTKAEIKRLQRCYAANPDYRPSDIPIYGPGTQFIRDWNGRCYVATQKPTGFEFDGTLYGSLSEVARVITGTRWSGPAFFGLKEKR